MRMRCVIWPSVVWYSSTLSHKRHDFRKQTVTENKTCILIFSRTFVWNISHCKQKSARYYHNWYIGLHVKYQLFLFDVDETWIFSTDFQEIYKYQISRKSAQWKPSCCMRTDRHYEDSTRFSQFWRTRPSKQDCNWRTPWHRINPPQSFMFGFPCIIS